MNVLHIIKNSLPFISGSTIRSKYIFKYQRKFANVFVTTTYLYKNKNNMEIINDIPYFRMNRKLSPLLRFYHKWYLRIRVLTYRFFSIDITNKILELPLSFFMKRHVKNLIKTYKIDLIHNHSQKFNGKYTLEIARKLNIPYVYEVRGFAEKSLLATTKGWRMPHTKVIGFIFRKSRNRETKILKSADFITTLSEPMKDLLVERGIRKERIIVVPNSIDKELLKQVEEEHNLKEKLLLKDYFILGHFGRLRWYEGIETLLAALRIVLDHGKKIKLIIAGGSDDRYLIYLKKEIKNKKLNNHVSFLGFIPHEEINKYYSIADIIVIPRNNISVCRDVTPLKPIDAMAFKTLVMASDLPALRYTITPYKTGILFEPENPEDLANKILEYMEKPEQYQEIITNAYNNIIKNFSWESVVPRYEKAYNIVIKNN